MEIRIDPTTYFQGEPQIPGDKSVSHRAELFAGLASGTSEITGLSDGEDVISTRRCLIALGVKFRQETNRWVVQSTGRLAPPTGDLDCGNSGTTMRLLMGILAGQPFSSRLHGDASLSRRPMARVAEPLRKMGARFALTAESFAPLTVEGTAELTGIDWNLKVASAQVKSAILLAGLFARGTTRLTGEIHSRDHTERMLPHFGVQVETSPGSIAIAGGQRLRAAQIAVPADPSSAAFWLAAACVVRGGRVQIKGLLLNPSRTGFLRAIQRMGAQVTERLTAKEPELVGEVEVRGSALRGVSIPNQEVASLIDELPMLAVLACYAEGVTEVHGAEELRVKETDRIEAVAKNLNRMGAQIETFPDGFRIRGPQPLRGARIDSFGDHRIAMAFAVGALGADGPTTIENAESVGISYPTFFETLRRLSHRG